MKITVFILGMIGFLLSCSESKSESANVESPPQITQGFPIDTNLEFKKLSKLRLPSEIFKSKGMKKVKKDLAETWIKPLSLSGDMSYDCKFVSYQGQTKTSYLFIVAQAFEHFDHSDEEPFGLDQYLISVNKKDGKLLSGIILQGYFSGDQLGDSSVVNKGQVMNLRIINSVFDQNTIFVKYRTSFLKSEEEVIEEESSQRFFIREDGMIVKAK